jgi:hypothetical protein
MQRSCICENVGVRKETERINFMSSITCINTNFIHICNTNKCTYKSIHNLFCSYLRLHVSVIFKHTFDTTIQALKIVQRIIETCRRR